MYNILIRASCFDIGISLTNESCKITRFKTLPNNLIFHLKRFKFSYEKMKKVKILNRFEFPLILDMSRYVNNEKGN